MATIEPEIPADYLYISFSFSSSSSFFLSFTYLLRRDSLRSITMKAGVGVCVCVWGWGGGEGRAGFNYQLSGWT